MTSRFVLTVVSAVFLATLGSARQFWATAQAAQRVGELKLPPITYLCPMNGAPMPDGTIHADVYEISMMTTPSPCLAKSSRRSAGTSSPK
jgi:hypothetical protein